MQVRQTKHKTVASQHAELSESILKPTCIRGPKIQQKDLEVLRDEHDTTIFDESIFGPIQRKKDRVGLEAGAVAPPLNAYQQRVGKKTSKSSAFELMMKRFERDRNRERDGNYDKRKDQRRDEQLDGGWRNNILPALKNMKWKNFVNGVNTKPVCYFNNGTRVL